MPKYRCDTCGRPDVPERDIMTGAIEPVVRVCRQCITYANMGFFLEDNSPGQPPNIAPRHTPKETEPAEAARS